MTFCQFNPTLPFGFSLRNLIPGTTYIIRFQSRAGNVESNPGFHNFTYGKCIDKTVIYQLRHELRVRFVYDVFKK